MTDFKTGQLARSKKEGKVIQIRRIKFKDGEWMLGIGKIAFTWVFAKDYEKVLNPDWLSYILIRSLLVYAPLNSMSGVFLYQQNEYLY